MRTATATVPVRFADADAWYEWTMSHGQRQMWDAVPAAEVDAVRAAAAVALEEGRRPDGQMGFDQQVRYTLGRKA